MFMVPRWPSVSGYDGMMVFAKSDEKPVETDFNNRDARTRGK